MQIDLQAEVSHNFPRPQQEPVAPQGTCLQVTFGAEQAKAQSGLQRRVPAVTAEIPSAEHSQISFSGRLS